MQLWCPWVPTAINVVTLSLKVMPSWLVVIDNTLPCVGDRPQGSEAYHRPS